MYGTGLPSALETGTAFGSPEERFNIPPRPTRSSHFSPEVKVAGQADGIDHPIDRTAAAKDATSAPCLGSLITAWIALSLV